MKDANHSGKHGRDDAPESFAPRFGNPNFKVNLDESDLAVGEDYAPKPDDAQTDTSKKYDFDNFISNGNTAPRAPRPARKPGSERTRPSAEKAKKGSGGANSDSEEINSFSNNSAKNTAMRNTKADLRHQKRELRKHRKEMDRNNRNIFRVFWLITCLVVGIIIGQYLLVGFNDFLAISRPDAETVTIELKENPDIDTVTELLAENGVIKSKAYFKLFTTITKKADNFRQGTFEIQTNLDYQAIISFLQSNANRSDIVEVQFTEGMNVLEVADKLYENGVITDTEEFLDLCNTDEFDEQFTFLKNTENNDKYYKLEGYLFPDTYQFYLNENPKSVLEKMINNYENRVYYNKRRVPGHKREVAIGKLLRESEYTPDQIMIIASIIQAEALNTDDMYNISSVIHNRLKSDPDSGVLTLDCDSTIYYPYRSKSSVPNSLGNYTSRYDTYNVIGLPAGEICSPGADAIVAALLPNETDYLFFCHSQGSDTEPAYAYYATNIDDHNYNLQLAGLAPDE